MPPSRAVFLIAALAVSPVSAGQASPSASRGRTPADDAEGVSLRDGSFLKGQVQGLENNVLKFRSKDAGVLDINWAHVNAFRSDGPLTFVMNDGQIYTGTVRPGDLLGSLWVRTAGGDPSSPMKGGSDTRSASPSASSGRSIPRMVSPLRLRSMQAALAMSGLHIHD
jgi:hypothetical protein